MKLIKDLLDYSTPWALPNVYVFTGNAVMKNNGAIVMGRGAAKQVRNSYPGIDILLGTEIKKATLHDRYPPYVVGIKMRELPNAIPRQFLLWFKVKHHWRDDADIELIEHSTAVLKQIAKDYPIHTYHMNFPGVGNGRLNQDDVQPILETLPDNVWVYR